MADGQLEQLWYTWTRSGLERAPGLQARAASDGLRDTRGKRYAALKSHLSYELPGAGMANPADAPVCLALVGLGDERALLQKVSIGADQHGRPGNFFVHALVGPPSALTLSVALRCWRAPFWQQSDAALPPGDTRLPPFDFAAIPSDLPPLPPPKAEHLRYVIAATISLTAEQRLYIAVPGETMIGLLAAATSALPAPLLRSITFSTYERDVLRSPVTIVGTVLPAAGDEREGAVQDLPEVCYQRGPALNGWSHRTSPVAEAAALQPYVAFAVDRLVADDAPAVQEFLDLAEAAGLTTGDAVGRAYDWRAGIADVTPSSVDALLNDVQLLAFLLPQPVVRRALLRALVTQPARWRTRFGPALERIQENASGPVTSALAALADEAGTLAEEHLTAEGLATAALLVDTLPQMLGTPGEGARCAALFRAVTTRYSSGAAEQTTAEFSRWVLSLAARAQPRPTAMSLRQWLPSSWEELESFLANSAVQTWWAAGIQWMVGPGGQGASMPTTIIADLISQRLDLVAEALTELLRKRANETASDPPARTYHDYAKAFVVGLGRKQVSGHIELIQRLLGSNTGASEALVSILMSVVNAEPDEFMRFMERNTALLQRQDFRLAQLKLVRSYLTQLTPARCRQLDTRLALNAIRSALSLFLPGDDVRLLRAWTAVANFLANPDCTREKLTGLAEAIDTLHSFFRRSPNARTRSDPRGEDLTHTIVQSLVHAPVNADQLQHIVELLGGPLADKPCSLFRLLVAALPDDGTQSQAGRLRAYLTVAVTWTQPPCDLEASFARKIQHMDEETLRQVDRALRDPKTGPALPKQALKAWQRYVDHARPPTALQRAARRLGI